MKYWIFDLDKTIYPKESGLFKAVDEKINEYLITYLNFNPNEVNLIRKKYWLKYGTTLNGLIKFHNVNPIHYLEFVHDVNITQFLDKDEELIEIFKSISGKKIIFTNGYKPFAQKVLNILGIKNFFDEIIDITFIDFIPKPYVYGYKKLINNFEISPEKAIFFDDFYLNLIPAKSLGMTTVLVNNNSKNHEYIDYKIPDIKKLKNFKFCIDI